jgi:hypothetical protein
MPTPPQILHESPQRYDVGVALIHQPAVRKDLRRDMSVKQRFGQKRIVEAVALVPIARLVSALNDASVHTMSDKTVQMACCSSELIHDSHKRLLAR